MTFAARHYANPALPLWARVVMFAIDHDGRPLERAELHDAVDPMRLVRSAEISRAIRHGIRIGMLAPGSCAAMLRLASDEEQAA